MKTLSEYSAATPLSELYRFLAEAVVDERITSFSALLEQTKSLPQDARTKAVYARLFKLIRKLHWGFFRDIDPATFPKVWNEVVIPHPVYSGCGDLKRNLTISDVYVGILDLHGYTRFCEKNKNNLSMLQLLDDMIQVDVAKIAREQNVVLQRRQGDEMVLVGASAADLISTTLLIIDYFAKRRTINFSGKTEHRTGYRIILEEMHISAGIAGGKKFTPFIITRDGDLSGGVVNTAARLQGRANEVSGDTSCIIVTRAVSTAFAVEGKKRLPDFLQKTSIDFFDAGRISFKGIAVAVAEVVFDASQRYKLRFENDLLELYRAVESGAWKDGIFAALIALLIRVYQNMPTFEIEAVSNGLQTTLTNDQLMIIASEALNRFRLKQDYAKAIGELGRLVEYTRAIPRFDRLSLEYAERILSGYETLVGAYADGLDAKIKDKIQTVLPAKHRQLFDESRRSAMIYERLRDQVKNSLTPLEISLLWASTVDKGQSKLEISIHSGKR